MTALMINGLPAPPRRATLLLLVCALPSLLLAQNGDAVVPASVPGFQVRSVSAYGAYYSSGIPANGGFAASDSNVSSDMSFGGSIEFDWMRFTDRSSFALTYTPSYTGRVRFSSLDALNHALSLNAGHHLAPRWNFNFSAAASLSTLEQSLFAPTNLSTVASLPSTFQDLASGILRSQFTTNPLLGSALSSVPLSESPLNTVLYGQRRLTSSLETTLSYSYSPRLSLNFSFGGSRNQHLSDSDPSVAGINTFGLDATSGHAGISLAYSLSPRTQIGASVFSSRTLSAAYDTYTTTTSVSVGRTLAHRWIVQAHAGAGVTNPVRQAFQSSVRPFPAAGVGLTYKTSSHTFLGTYDRTTNDSYGLGTAVNSSANATWRWQMPGRHWWVDSTFGWQQLGGVGRTPLTGWRTTTGFNQALGPHVAIRAEYAYLDYYGGAQDSTYRVDSSAVRFSINWFPPANVLR